jgi:hypothetical protein
MIYRIEYTQTRGAMDGDGDYSTQTEEEVEFRSRSDAAARRRFANFKTETEDGTDFVLRRIDQREKTTRLA